MKVNHARGLLKPEPKMIGGKGKIQTKPPAEGMPAPRNVERKASEKPTKVKIIPRIKSFVGRSKVKPKGDG